MKGSYVLVIKVVKNSLITIGSLGKIHFDKGYYAYIGSALNNLEKRVGRHLTRNKKLHWHIDYLLKNKNAKIIKIFYKESPKKEECTIVQFVAQHGKPIKRFGCSDCNCESHLYKIKDYHVLKSSAFEKTLCICPRIDDGSYYGDSFNVSI